MRIFNKENYETTNCKTCFWISKGDKTYYLYFWMYKAIDERGRDMFRLDVLEKGKVLYNSFWEFELNLLDFSARGTFSEEEVSEIKKELNI